MAGALLAEQAKWIADQVDFPDECVESFSSRDKILVSIMESDWQQLQFVFKFLEKLKHEKYAAYTLSICFACCVCRCMLLLPFHVRLPCVVCHTAMLSLS